MIALGGSIPARGNMASSQPRANQLNQNWPKSGLFSAIIPGGMWAGWRYLGENQKNLSSEHVIHRK